MTELELLNQNRYREYWAYLRHIETLRFTLGALIVTVVGVVVAVGGLAPLGKEAEGLAPWVLVFLSLFLCVAAVFIVSHKKYYDMYSKMLDHMDPELRRQREALGNWAEPFVWLLLLVTLPQLAIICSAFTLGSWPWLQRFVVALFGYVGMLVPWFYYLTLRDRQRKGCN